MAEGEEQSQSQSKPKGYKAVHRIRHNGTSYSPGDDFDVTDKNVLERMKKLGSIEAK